MRQMQVLDRFLHPWQPNGNYLVPKCLRSTPFSMANKCRHRLVDFRAVLLSAGFPCAWIGREIDAVAEGLHEGGRMQARRAKKEQAMRLARMALHEGRNEHRSASTPLDNTETLTFSQILWVPARSCTFISIAVLDEVAAKSGITEL